MPRIHDEPRLPTDNVGFGSCDFLPTFGHIFGRGRVALSEAGFGLAEEFIQVTAR